jgi:hypothetical protein
LETEDGLRTTVSRSKIEVKTGDSVGSLVSIWTVIRTGEVGFVFVGWLGDSMLK